MQSLIFEICPEPPIAQANHWPFYTTSVPDLPSSPNHQISFVFHALYDAAGFLSDARGCGSGTRFFLVKRSPRRSATCQSNSRYPEPASSCEHQFPLFYKPCVPPGRERRACCEYLNQGHGLSPLPPGKTTTPNYSLNHARSASDTYTVSTFPLWHRSRRLRAVAILSLEPFSLVFAGCKP
jgi:hypothetical protein